MSSRLYLYWPRILGQGLGDLGLLVDHQVLPLGAVGQVDLGLQRAVGIDGVAAMDEEIGLVLEHGGVGLHAAAALVDAPALPRGVAGPGEGDIAQIGGRGAEAAAHRLRHRVDVGEIGEGHAIEDVLAGRQILRHQLRDVVVLRQHVGIGQYLFDPAAPELADYDSGIVNLECTKRAAAFGVWGVWSLLGTQIFTDMIDVTIDLAQKFHCNVNRGRRFRAAARTAMQHRGIPLLAARTSRCSTGESRRAATSAASRGDRVRRVLPGAKPHRRPSGLADNDDESADDGRRPRAACSNACAASDASLSTPATNPATSRGLSAKRFPLFRTRRLFVFARFLF